MDVDEPLQFVFLTLLFFKFGKFGPFAIKTPEAQSRYYYDTKFISAIFFIHLLIVTIIAWPVFRCV